MLKITEEFEGGDYLIVSVEGLKEFKYGNELSSLLKQYAEKVNKALIIDLDKVTFIHSMFINSLVVTRNLLHEKGIELWLFNVNDAVSQVLTVTNIDKIVKVLPDRKALDKQINS
ncbi:MAG: STAS domain-containing protein [Nitrospinae bacterium]|nr:STAS domain-containing protein [Nitrospinota bacterium]